ILTVLGPVRVEVLQHCLRHALHELARALVRRFGRGVCRAGGEHQSGQSCGGGFHSAPSCFCFESLSALPSLLSELLSLSSWPRLARFAKSRFTRFSSTSADWVNSMRSPSVRYVSEPPGPMPTYLPPSNPCVWMLASLSSGMRSKRGSMRMWTTAR